jgi:hypothetical protein
MSKDPKDFPPPPDMPIFVDAAEFAAISTVVRAVVATMANQIERSKVGAGQAWINGVSAACQDAILRGDISIGARDVEDFRRKTMEHVNRILHALGPPSGPSGADH